MREKPLFGVRDSSDTVRDGFEAFYRREYRQLLALAYALCGNRLVAEELVQEACVAAYIAWDHVDDPERWIRTVVANQTRSWFRRRYAEVSALRRIGVEGEARTTDMPADAAHFWLAVSRLPRRQAQTVALYYLEGRSIRDVALTLGCSESTARVHLSQGRRTLARVLGVEEGS